ncbi:MAG: helix-turn-helix transcriptional regulator [Mycobacterium sp.]|nr:helix-turn-helix transcriptional regulator [Mycobacterium sp.]
MTRGDALGEYLRLRRGQVRPEDVGLVPGPRRRVEGLRREELAALAGISADYYLRIEQGRNAHPSPQILDALARALRMDAAASVHLHQLARGDRPVHTGVEHVDDDVVSLLDQLSVPAFVAGRCLDCLASNPLAQALSPNFAPGRNLLRQLFLDPAERRLHLDWDEATAGVAWRSTPDCRAARRPTRAFDAIVDGASLPVVKDSSRSGSGADVGYRPTGTSRPLHPRSRRIAPAPSTGFPMPDSDGQHLQIYHAVPGSGTAAKLRAARGSLDHRTRRKLHLGQWCGNRRTSHPH